MLARNSDLWRLAARSAGLSSISRNSRAFWIANTDCVAKVFKSSITSGGNSRLIFSDHQPAHDAVLAKQGTARLARKPNAPASGACAARKRALPGY